MAKTRAGNFIGLARPFPLTPRSVDSSYKTLLACSVLGLLTSAAFLGSVTGMYAARGFSFSAKST